MNAYDPAEALQNYFKDKGYEGVKVDQKVNQVSNSLPPHLSTWWVSYYLKPHVPGWAQVVACDTRDAIKKVEEHFGKDNVVYIDKVEHLNTLKFTPEHYEPPTETPSIPAIG